MLFLNKILKYDKLTKHDCAKRSEMFYECSFDKPYVFL